MPFDVFAAMGALVRAESTRSTEPAPAHPARPVDSTDPTRDEPQAGPDPLQESAAGRTPGAGALPPAATRLPGLSG